MDALVQKAIQQSAAAVKTGTPWTADEPYPQPYFAFDAASQQWESRTVSAEEKAQATAPGITKLALASWNVDFMLPQAEARMTAALITLQNLSAQLPSTTAVVIFLQECVESDLSTIAGQPWIRDNFHITDLDTTYWASSYYGTTVLVDRRLPITSLFRVHYSKTRMERDALFVDVALGQDQAKVIRLCNTHLESLALEPPFRPLQVQIMAKYMHADEIDGAVAAGDFNAIQDSDEKLHSDNVLKDAYLELGGQEHSDQGYTWGQQAATLLRERFGCSRMDKVYYCGQPLGLRSFERFGQGVVLEDKEQQDELVGLGFDKAWITDHLGIKVEFDIA
ncbi:Endonuclease/exonuclease/phosphatase [Xylariales sp. PMI_506]|nr:Endonuclease/exonuclease/phosphatase [Xylariales sp. PMI_506]